MSVTVTTLPSGLRIVTDAIPHLQTASLGVWVGVGSRFETEAEHGLSHFLEHMAFKGTRRRSARRIAEDIESAGGDLNAATSTEQTAYYARVLPGDVPLALDILGDILRDSVFDPAEVEREKEVVLQEIGAAEDIPDDLVFELLMATAFPGQPIGRPILGTPERVRGFDREGVRAFVDGRYRASTTVIAAAGAVDHDRFAAETAARADVFRAEAAPMAEPARYLGGEARLKRRFEQTHVIVAFEGLSFHDPAHYAAHIFSQAVGGNMSSRLFQTVREERGLAYAIHTFDWAYADTGLFGFYAATAPKSLGELVAVALDAVADATVTLGDVEIERAKAQFKVSLLVALESSSARAEQLARQHLAFGRTIEADEIVRKIDAITTDDVRRVGARMLGSRPTVALVGPGGRAAVSVEDVMARLRSARGS